MATWRGWQVHVQGGRGAGDGARSVERRPEPARREQRGGTRWRGSWGLVSQLHPGAGWEAPGQGRHDAGEESGARDTADGGDRQAGCCQGHPSLMMVPPDRPRGRHRISPESLEPPPGAALLEHFLPSLFLQAGEDGPRPALPDPGGTHSPVSALPSRALSRCGRPGHSSSRHPLRGGPWAPLPQPRDPHSEPEAGVIPPSVLISSLFRPLALTTNATSRGRGRVLC